MKDTLAIVDNLKEAGFDSNSLATKADIQKLQTEINHRFDKVDTILNILMYRFNKVDILLNILMWVIGIGFAAAYGLKLFS